jgi:hypothetical protein
MTGNEPRMLKANAVTAMVKVTPNQALNLLPSVAGRCAIKPRNAGNFYVDHTSRSRHAAHTCLL